MSFDQMDPINVRGQVRAGALRRVAEQAALPGNTLPAGAAGYRDAHGAVSVADEAAGLGGSSSSTDPTAPARLVRVAGLTPDGPFLPGARVTPDPATGLLADDPPGDAVWLLLAPLPGPGALRVGDPFVCVPDGTRGDGLPVYAAGKSLPGPVRLFVNAPGGPTFIEGGEIEFHYPTFLVSAVSDGLGGVAALVQLSWGTNVLPVGNLNLTGTGQQAARVDHVHQGHTVQLDTGAPSTPGVTVLNLHYPTWDLIQTAPGVVLELLNWGDDTTDVAHETDPGASEQPARSDHAHAGHTAELSDLSVVIPGVVAQRYLKPTFALLAQQDPGAALLQLAWGGDIQYNGCANKPGESERPARSDHAHANQGHSGTFTVVDGSSQPVFDPVACTLTWRTRTVTVLCGLITNVTQPV